MNASLEDFVLFMVTVIIIFWCIFGYPSGYENGRQQGICEVTYGSGANYIDGECLIKAKK